MEPHCATLNIDWYLASKFLNPKGTLCHTRLSFLTRFRSDKSKFSKYCLCPEVNTYPHCNSERVSRTRPARRSHSDNGSCSGWHGFIRCRGSKDVEGLKVQTEVADIFESNKAWILKVKPRGKSFVASSQFVYFPHVRETFQLMIAGLICESF